MIKQKKPTRRSFAYGSLGWVLFLEIVLGSGSVLFSGGGNGFDDLRGRKPPVAAPDSEHDPASCLKELGLVNVALHRAFAACKGVLIKLNSKKESEEMPLASIAAEIKDALLQEKRRAAYDSKINQLKILYPVDMMI